MSLNDKQEIIMKRILPRALTTCILLSGYIASAYSATGDTTNIDITINVTGRTCQFSKATDTIQLEPVRVEDFIHTSRIIGIKEVPVSISCSNNVDTVKIHVKGEPAYFNNGSAPSTLHTGLFQNTGTARHIGLAFMDKDNKQMSSVNDGNSVVVTLENGEATYVFKAGYGALVYSDMGGAQHVTGGSFQSSVHLTFDYS